MKARPPTVFVAGFVGKTNALPGVVSRVEAGTEIQATAYDTQGENLLAPGMDVLVELPEGRMAVVEGE